MAPKNRDDIEDLIESVLTGTDFFLVDFAIKGAKRPVVEVYLDGFERGITMDECAEISNELGFLMDAHEIFPDAYRLNVSSPGLDRPLTDRRQYAKNKGHKVDVKIQSDEGEPQKIRGLLQEITEQNIVVNPANDEPVTLGFDCIIATKVIPSLKQH